MSRQILFRNFELLEPSFGELRGGYQLLVEGDTVRELSESSIEAPEAMVIDCGKRTLMPGLIDCHVHAIHSEVNVSFMEMLPLTLVTARAAQPALSSAKKSPRSGFIRPTTQPRPCRVRHATRSIAIGQNFGR